MSYVKYMISICKNQVWYMRRRRQRGVRGGGAPLREAWNQVWICMQHHNTRTECKKEHAGSKFMRIPGMPPNWRTSFSLPSTPTPTTRGPPKPISPQCPHPSDTTNCDSASTVLLKILETPPQTSLQRTTSSHHLPLHTRHQPTCYIKF